MRSFTPFMVLLPAASVGITTGHVVNVNEHRQDTSHVLSGANHAGDFDMFYRRPNSVSRTAGKVLENTRSGMCAQISLHKDVMALLVEARTSNVGLLNPAVLGPGAVTILIRVILQYTEIDDNGIVSDEKTVEFDAAVEPDDWTNHPCGHPQQGCIVFQNDKLRLIAPNALGEAGVLSIQAFGKFTTGSTVNVVRISCDIRCHTPGACDGFETGRTIDLDPDGPGTDFGTVVRSTLPDDLCVTSIFDDLHARVEDA